MSRTDQFVLSGTSAVALPGLPAGATLTAVATVKDALNPAKGAVDGSGYVVTNDFTVQTGTGTITRVGAGAIADGTLVNVSYSYVPQDYFQPIRLYDVGSVESRFGSGLDSTGSAINSAVSYAASIAFENGADSVVVQPLFVRTTPGDATTAPLQPNATQTAALSSWTDTLYVLRDIEDINIIVPIIGQSVANVGDSTQLTIMQAVQDHCYFMAQNDQYIIGLFGEDASTSSAVATKATLQSHAGTLRSRYGGVVAEQTVFVAPAKFQRALPVYGKYLNVGGQYVAAAVSGMLASQSASVSLTRKVVSGFTRVLDTRDTNEKNSDASNGLMVIEERRGNIVVRHGITLDTTTSARRELSVVRAKHRMIESVKDTIDRQIIGNLIADGNAPATVTQTVIGVLEALRQDRDLVDYSGVDSRIMSLEPTLIQVRFSYRPAFPLNYVDIIFSLDMTTGDISTQTDTGDVLGNT